VKINPDQGSGTMEKKIDTEEYLSVTEAAEQLGTTHLRILVLIKEGALKGSQEGDKWFITRESLDCFQKHGGDLRVQAGCRTSCGGNCGSHG
jgi:excisionase family DNA binding protein